jgi:hypothetical protein
MERLIEIGKWLIAPPPELRRPGQLSSGSLNNDSADWYAGLCVDAHHFSDQLQLLQESLNRSGHVIHQQAPESAAITARAS